MTYLLDTHVLLALMQRRTDRFPPDVRRIVTSRSSVFVASAASIWEIAIKVRSGKLQPTVPIANVPAVLRALECRLLEIDERHAVAEVDPAPPTHDPFDRMLLAQCAVEDMRLVTLDRALVDHPLSATAPSSLT